MIARLFRLTKFELGKLWGRRTLLVPQGFYSRRQGFIQALCAPPFVLLVLLVIAGATVLSGYGEWVLDQAQKIATGKEADPFKNAWSTMASTAYRGQILAMIFLLVIAGTSIAEEAQYGTLKAVLTRPYARTDVILSKAISLTLFLFVVIGVLFAAGYFTGSVRYSYVDVTDPEYKDYVHTTAASMWGSTGLAFALLFPPLSALIAYALFVSAVIEQPGYAVGVAIGGVFVLWMIGSVFEGLAPYSFVHHSLEPLQILQSKGAAFAGSEFKKADVIKSVGVSLLTAGFFYSWTMWRLSVRDIGD